MKSRTARAAALTLFVASVLTSSGAAQDVTTGEISGAVVAVLGDREEPLKGASMMLRNLRTGNRRPGRTDSKGNFLFIQLVPGYYDVRAEPDGYESEERLRIFVPLNLPRVVIPTFRLRPRPQVKAAPVFRARTSLIGARVTPYGFRQDSGQAQTPAPGPSLSGLTSLVSLGDWALRSNFDSSIIQNLPLPGCRSFDHLARFVPGVVGSPFSS